MMSPGGSNVVVAGAELEPLALLGDHVDAREVDSLGDLRTAVREGSADCVLAGPRLEGATAVDVLRTVRGVDDSLPVVVWPAGVDADAATAAVRYDATEYLPDADPAVAAEHVRTALEEHGRRESDWRLRAAVESVQDQVFALDDDARLTLVTEALADRVGRERPSLVGEPLDALLSADGVDRALAVVNDLLAGATPDGATFEAALEPVDGEPVPVQVELSLLDDHSEFDGIVGVVRDRSEVARTRRELETARERFRYLFEHIPDAVVETEYVDGEPVVRSVNAAFRDQFGYDPDEVVGSSLTDYVLTDEMDGGAPEVDRLTKDGEESVEQVRRRTADGVRDFLLRCVPYRTGEGDVKGFAIYTDVTERTERERRLSVLTNVLRHNLRTEMNIVFGNADAILEQDPDSAVVALVEELRRSAETVVDLGQTARDIEALVERTWGTEQSVDLVRLLDDVLWRIERAHPEATVETALPERAPVCGDEAIERAVHELLENAIVHHDGEPTVSVTVERPDDTWVDLRVADDGPGIPAFERELVTGEREVSQLEHGSGLGLWIARWTAESLGGALSLREGDDGGTVARLRLRAA